MSAVAGAYDRWAATYDAMPNKTRDLSMASLRAADLPLKGATVIEIGCGTGLNTIWLAERARHVIALDASPGMQAVARERLAGAANVSFHICDITTTWPVDSADVIVCNLVLEHIADLAPVFAHATRALKPGGVMFITELHPAKQRLGKKAVFTAGGADVEIAAYLHDISDFTQAAAPLRVERLEEHWDPGVSKSEAPRLLALTFIK